jgi:hypothetical protein
MSDADIMDKTNHSVNIMNTNMYEKLSQENPSKYMKTPTVLNLDNDGDGTHWVAIKPNKEYSDNSKVKILDYHDSFGVIPPFHIKNTIIQYNPYVEQKRKENDCGERAINFLRK